MISATLTADPAPSEAAVRAREIFSETLTQVQDFGVQVLELGPQELAIRAGLTLAIIVGAYVAIGLIRFIFHAISRQLTPKEDREKGERIKLGGWTIAITRIAIYFGALLVILIVWGVDLAGLMAGPFGVILATFARVALTIVVMLALIDIARALITRVFSRISERARSPRRAAQLRTVAPVVGGVITAILVVIATMMVMSNIGIEIGPLLAGAGIIGVALGFGAQSLVKDFLTGIFLIIEDVVSIGDVAQIGDAAGVVEDMSLRTIKLRAFDGTLQVIPYGEAQVIYNKTKDFSNAVFDLGISYSSDVIKALDLMKQVGDELRQDPEFGSQILQDIEVFGVDRLADSSVVLKGRMRTRPGSQWSVGREYLKRIKLAFDANGIEIPFPHLKLVPPDEPIPVGETHPRAAE